MELKNLFKYSSSSYSLMPTLFFFLLLTQSVSATKQNKPQWQGNLNYTLKGYPLDKVWPLVENYCDLYKLFNELLGSFCVNGVHARAGSIRYVVYQWPPQPLKNLTAPHIEFETHKLLKISQEEHYVYYVMTNNNFVMNNYHATMKVSAAPHGSTLYQWLYRVDPVDGYTEDSFYNVLYPFFLNAMNTAKKIVSSK